MERKLTAILSADVEGYSRLMGENEEATVRTLTEYREVMGSLIERHRGRVIDSPGDNLLAQFASAVDAVECAVAIQKDLRRRNSDYVEDRRMNYRIGVNLGDVIVDGERIYGDGVNIAARVESLAEGGGICVSSTVYDHVANKLSYDFDDHGEHSVKNIAEPVNVYAVRWDVEKTSRQKDKPSKRGVWIAAVAIVAVFAIIGIGVVFWDKVKTLEKPTVEETTPPTISEIPSIAVLPFRDMSPQKDQEYFCEGIAEELLNAFTKVAGLRVAARTSSFRFKDEAISTIGKLLNVTTVLEGSVRKSGNKLRITAQLINVTDGFHLWSETYDRELKNIFAIQDEISQAIAQALHVKLMGEVSESLVKTYTENIEAYDKYLLGRYRWNKRGVPGEQSKENLMAAMEHFKEAISLDPNYALAYSGLADVYNFLPEKVPSINKDDVKAQAEEAVKKALALDPKLAEAHASFGYFKLRFQNDYKGAEREFLRAIELNPKYAPAHHFYGMLLGGVDRMDDVLAERRKAYELEPFSRNYSFVLGRELVSFRHYDAGIKQLQRTLDLDSKFPGTWYFLGFAYIFVNKFEDAKHAWGRLAELTGENKKVLQHFVLLIEEHKRTGEPVSPSPEIVKLATKLKETHLVYAFVGQKEKALEALEQMFEEEIYFYLGFPVFDTLRSEPRFIALERKRKQIIDKRMMGLEE